MITKITRKTPPPKSGDDDRLDGNLQAPYALSIDDAAAYIGCPANTLRATINKGMGPRVRRITARVAVILTTDLQDWLRSL